MNTRIDSIALCLALTVMPVAAPATTHNVSTNAATDAALSQGEVRKVDKGAGKITIRHGPLANLEMPSMTMVFQVKDRAMLDQVKSGDKVKFVAEKIDGAFTVTRIENEK